MDLNKGHDITEPPPAPYVHTGYFTIGIIILHQAHLDCWLPAQLNFHFIWPSNTVAVPAVLVKSSTCCSCLSLQLNLEHGLLFRQITGNFSHYKWLLMLVPMFRWGWMPWLHIIWETISLMFHLNVSFCTKLSLVFRKMFLPFFQTSISTGQFWSKTPEIWLIM